MDVQLITLMSILYIYDFNLISNPVDWMLLSLSIVWAIYHWPRSVLWPFRINCSFICQDARISINWPLPSSLMLILFSLTESVTLAALVCAFSLQQFQVWSLFATAQTTDRLSWSQFEAGEIQQHFWNPFLMHRLLFFVSKSFNFCQKPFPLILCHSHCTASCTKSSK